MEPSNRSLYVTLLSNTSEGEFPHNTPASFKARLAYPLRVRNWQVGLAGLYLSGPQGTYVTLKELTDDASVVSGVSLMKAMIFKAQKNEIEEAQSKGKRLYDRYRVTYEWSGENLHLMPKKLGDIRNTTVSNNEMQFHIHTSLAKMGWLVETGKDKYALGPNLRFENQYTTSGNDKYMAAVGNTELSGHDLW